VHGRIMRAHTVGGARRELSARLFQRIRYLIEEYPVYV
jgi:hypothetical protein